VVSSQELGTGGPEPVVLLEELQALQATNGTAANATAANATAANATEVNATAATPAPPAQNDAKKKEKLKEGMTKAKIQQYLRKIREFQRMKKQRWDPSVEQNLAEKLVTVDGLMEQSPEEKELEAKLRKSVKGMKGTGVELSLTKRAQELDTEKKQAKAQKASKRREAFLRRM